MPSILLESNKPAPSPKPRLTPKPFTLEKNPTIKPILAPKPQSKPRPEPTRISGSKPDLPNTPKPTARLVSTNPDRPAATSFRTPNSLKTGQTTKPVIQPFKPVPPLDPVEPSKSSCPIPTGRQKPAASNLAYSKSLKTYSAAEWSGTTSVKNESGESKEGSMTRAKSMEFLAAIGQDEEAKSKSPPEAAVQLRTQPRRPRPVSAIFSAAPAKTETPVPVPRWATRRPLSADLTSKFESIGLSLHRKSPKANTPPDQDQEQEKTPQSATSDSADSFADQTHSEQKAEETAAKDSEDVKPVASIKSRISLLLDASSSPGTAADPLSPVQPVPEAESSVGVKQLIKQLTVDTTSSPIPAVKPVLKPRPLPLDLTKKFSSERSPDPEAADRHDISKESQRGAEESTPTPNGHKTFLDFKGSPLESRKGLTPEGSEAGLPWAHPKESGSGAELHTVRASLFENIVERQSVFLMDQDESPKDGGVFFTRGNEEEEEEEEEEDDESLVTATYREPVSPSDPFRVSHAFDTVQAAEENRAVSESVPAAQWEDKATTLRTRRSERPRPTVQMADPLPRYLRVGALHKWTTTSFDQGEGSHKGISQESESKGQAGSEKDQDVAAPKRLKMLQGEEPQKLKATYFALTGHMQDAASLGEVGSSLVGANLPFNDLPVRSAMGGSQGQIYSARRNPSLEEAFGQISPTQEKFDELMQRNTVPSMEINSQMEEQTKADVMEIKKTKEQQGRERHLDNMNEHEEQAQVDFERMKELERQREFERQRQRVFEKEKRELEEKRQRQKLEMEKQKQQELERERQRQLQKEKREQERQKEMEMQQLVQLERQSLREKAEKEAKKLRQMALEQEMLKIKELEKRAEQKEMERKRELEKQRQGEMEKEKKQQDLERQQLEKDRLRKEQENERKRKEELEKLKEMERQQLVELEKQKSRERAEKEAERLKQMALEQESLRIRELEKEKERQRELEIQMEKERELAKNRQKQLDMEREQLENERLKREQEQERKRKEEYERLKELEKQRLREKKEKEIEKLRQMALEQEVLKIKELEKEKVKQREVEIERQMEIETREREKRRQREVEKEKQRQLDLERQQFENERLRREQEKDQQRKELEIEKHKAKEKLEKAEAEKMRHIAKQQELERQRLKEKQKKEEQERLWLESSTLRPKVLDLDSVLRSDLLSLASPQHGDASPRWREPYKPVILDIDSFTSHAQGSPGKDSLPASGIPGLDAEFGVRLQPMPERDVSWKVPAQTSAGFSSPVWTMSPQDPWELRPVEMSVDKPVMEPKRVSNKLSPELKQEQRHPSPQRHRPAFLDEPLFLSPLSGKEQQSRNSLHELSHSSFGEQIWIPREPQPPKERRDAPGHRRSHGSQELNRMRSRSMSRRSTPSSSAVEGSLRMRSRSAHRELDHHSSVQQKQSSETDSGTPVHDTDSQYGTWETELRTDDSLTPATPSSESNLSPSPRKPTPLPSPVGQTSQSETTTTTDGPPPSSSESQPLDFPNAPTMLLDNSALRSRVQLGKKRAQRVRPSKAARPSAASAQGDGGDADSWLYRDSTEAKVESKNDESESEEPAKRAEAGPAGPPQPQRVALFPGVDPSALKAHLKKRADSDNQTDGPPASPSQQSRSPKSPFLPRAARVLPTPGGKEHGQEDSPQWLKELKSKKRLSHYENES